MVKITFPDGSVREYEQGVTGLQIAESISPALARNVVSCGVNGETVELDRPINEDASVELYKFEDEQGKHTFWHTSATCSQRLFRSFIQASSLVSVQL